MKENCPECDKVMHTNTCTCGYSRTAPTRHGSSYSSPTGWGCKADGCPGIGSMGGVCRFHWNRSPKLFGTVTSTLQANAWLLRMIDWTACGNHDYSEGKVLERIANAVREKIPELLPKQGETPKVWAPRAEAWLEAQIAGKQPRQQELAA